MTKTIAWRTGAMAAVVLAVLAAQFEVSGGLFGAAGGQGRSLHLLVCCQGQVSGFPSATSSTTVTCDSACSIRSPRMPVTLTAEPFSGTQFVGWSGGCTGTNPTCTLSEPLRSELEIVAQFAPASSN